MIDLDTLTEAANELAPLPESLRRLLAIFADEEWDPDDVVKVVLHDPALTGRLLRVANSAMSSAQVEISTVDGAMLRLGRGLVLSLAMGDGVRPAVDTDLPQYKLRDGELWRHSVASASVVEELVRGSAGSLPPETVTAALLHDIGKLVLGRFLTDDVLHALAQAGSESGLTPEQAESKILLTTHAEVGALVAQHWSLPQIIVAGIMHHHNPAEVPSSDERTLRLCHAVHLADVTAHLIFNDTAEVEDCEQSLRSLSMNAEDHDRLREKSAERMDEVLAWYA